MPSDFENRLEKFQGKVVLDCLSIYPLGVASEFDVEE